MTNKILNFNAADAIAKKVGDQKHAASSFQLYNYLHMIPALQSSLCFDTLRYRSILTRDVVLVKSKALNLTLKAGDWEDSYTTTLRLFLEYANVKVNKSDLDDVIDKMSRENQYNAFLAFLDTADKNGNYNEDVYRQIMCDLLCCTDQPNYSIAWLKSLLAAIYTNQSYDGAISFYRPTPARYTVFGPQGIGKTVFFESLCNSLSFNLQSNADLSKKDNLSAISTHVITNFDDSGYSGRPEFVDAIKSLITTPTLQYRPAYGRRDIQRLNRTVFCGSTNRVYVFADTTGNRREYAIDAGVGFSESESRKHGQSWYNKYIKEGKGQIFLDLWKTFLVDNKKQKIESIFTVNSELDNERVAVLNAHSRRSDLYSQIEDLLNEKVYDTLFSAKNIGRWDIVSYLLDEDVHGGDAQKVRDNIKYHKMQTMKSFDELPAQVVNAVIRRNTPGRCSLNQIQTAIYDVAGYSYKRKKSSVVYSRK